MSKLGRLIREARRSRGLSLCGLARRVGASSSYLCRIENGDPSRLPSVRLLVRLSATLELDPDGVFIAAGRLPCDVSRWILATPGLLSRLRQEMAA